MRAMSRVGVLAILALGLLACASPVPEAAPREPLRIASWNMEHLAEQDGAGCRPRTEADYAAMRAYAESLDADVIAFQEVESAAAAARVFDPARYVIVIETRSGSGRRSPCRGAPEQMLTRQAVGFAISRDLRFERAADLTALQLDDPDLRSGVDVTLLPDGAAPLRLLAVHLKSGCAGAATGDDCAVLFRQTPIVESWIDARAASGQRFAVVGDFNRRLALADDVVWADWNDGEPTPLALAAGETPPACDPRFRSYIDHILIRRDAMAAPSSFREWTFVGDRLSDHCAISVSL